MAPAGWMSADAARELEARVDCALGSLGARSLRALGFGRCGLVSLDLGVSAVPSEVTA